MTSNITRTLSHAASFMYDCMFPIQGYYSEATNNNSNDNIEGLVVQPKQELTLEEQKKLKEEERLKYTFGPDNSQVSDSEKKIQEASYLRNNDANTAVLEENDFLRMKERTHTSTPITRVGCLEKITSKFDCKDHWSLREEDFAEIPPFIRLLNYEFVRNLENYFFEGSTEEGLSKFNKKAKENFEKFKEALSYRSNIVTLRNLQFPSGSNSYEVISKLAFFQYQGELLGPELQKARNEVLQQLKRECSGSRMSFFRVTLGQLLGNSNSASTQEIKEVAESDKEKANRFFALDIDYLRRRENLESPSILTREAVNNLFLSVQETRSKITINGKNAHHLKHFVRGQGIQGLMLNNHNFGDAQAATILKETLEENPSIERLSLKNNKLNASAIRQISAVQQLALRELDISNNNLDEDAVDALEVIVRQGRLKALYMDNCSLSDVSRERINQLRTQYNSLEVVEMKQEGGKATQITQEKMRKERLRDQEKREIANAKKRMEEEAAKAVEVVASESLANSSSEVVSSQGPSRLEKAISLTGSVGRALGQLTSAILIGNEVDREDKAPLVVEESEAPQPSLVGSLARSLSGVFSSSMNAVNAVSEFLIPVEAAPGTEGETTGSDTTELLPSSQPESFMGSLSRAAGKAAAKAMSVVS